jgi:hypothetical protein
MRHCLNMVTAMLFIATLFVGSAVAKDTPSHKLGGTHSVSNIQSHCIDSGGHYFEGPNGSYGCAGTGGTVTCTKGGQCTGTCPKC